MELIGMKVRLMTDKMFVIAECEKPAPGADNTANWFDEMEEYLGGEYEILDLEEDTQSALLKEWCFPFTTLLRAGP